MNPTGLRSKRIVAIDLARGAALLGMVAYHFAWDLHAFGLSATDPGVSLPWRALGQTVASTFLFLSGLSLVLARQRGGTTWAAFRRIAVITLAGAAVTGVTALAAPGQTILFGMLQCIALSNLLALPLVGRSAVASLVSAAIAFAVPAVVAGRATPSLWWLGVSDQLPATLDVRPLMPWLGVVLLGVAFGQAASWIWRPRVGGVFSAPDPHPRQSSEQGSNRHVDFDPSRRGLSMAWRRTGELLAASGRHSLAIYLVHQPALFAGFLILAAASIGSKPVYDAAGASFVTSCTDRCVERDTDPERCMALCRCVQTRLNADPDATHQPESLTLYATACVHDSTAPMSIR